MAEKYFRAIRVIERSKGFFVNEIHTLPFSSLPDHDVLIRVHYSSLNYKDALSAHGNKGITRQFPHTPGIDAAGEVIESRSDELQEGDQVIVSGNDLGMNTPGGFGEYIRVPASWCVLKPPNHGLRYFMVLGTAGLTAGLSVDRLTSAIAPGDGDVLITGASGGVGSLAIALLAKLGFQTVALTSKVDHSDMLASIGTYRVMDRSLLESLPEKPLLTELWAGVLDTVGGPLFSKALRAIKYGGAATTCGMVSGTELNTSMFPFILRGISLFGIDSVGISRSYKQTIWIKLDDQWSLPNLQKVVHEISLEELPAAIEKIYCGKMLGRVVLKHRWL
mgnify:CR=1 FL=1